MLSKRLVTIAVIVICYICVYPIVINKVYATEGAYQEFDNGRIYSSTTTGTYAVIGRVNTLHLQLGGTAVLGFPIDERYSTPDRGWCQQFELGLVCENELSVNFRELFTSKALLHYNNKIPCKWGGESVTEGVDCRGLALLSVREVTGKGAGDFNCDKFGACDPKKDIPSTGVDGLAKNYLPYLFGRKDFSYTVKSTSNNASMTLYDWENDGTIDHVNIILSFDAQGLRQWLYSNAECDLGDAHLVRIDESDLIAVKNKIIRHEILTEYEDQNLLPRIYLTRLNETDRSQIIEYLRNNNVHLDIISFVRNAVGNDYEWSKSIQN